MEHMRRVAFEIVLRACGFGSLAIFCLMFGTLYAPKAAFQIGGIPDHADVRDPDPEGL